MSDVPAAVTEAIRLLAVETAALEEAVQARRATNAAIEAVVSDKVLSQQRLSKAMGISSSQLQRRLTEAAANG